MRLDNESRQRVLTSLSQNIPRKSYSQLNGKYVIKLAVQETNMVYGRGQNEGRDCVTARKIGSKTA